uniref:Uncharacterized protein n=1 Tax=Meloidogyne enterolobii TaxID=390850 RepID=A0A6V7XE91_MELEN|nr:unnamed protein product [Meloidogyne enterolobii]
MIERQIQTEQIFLRLNLIIKFILLTVQVLSKSKSSEQQIPILTPIRTAPQPPSTTQNEIKDFEKENIPSSVRSLIENKDHPELNNNLIEEIKLVETSENVELVDDNAPPQSPRLKRSPAMNLTTFTSDTTSATTSSMPSSSSVEDKRIVTVG